MNYDNLTFEIKNKIGIITFNRPKALNAMNKETVLELGQAISECKNNPDIKVVVLTGAGGKSFVAGADISRMVSMTAMEGRDFMALGQEVLAQMETMPKPVIAAVNGFALGGGLEIAMACDVRFASENAVLGQPEILIGITPGWGGSQRFSRYLGKGIAKELVFSGESISAQRGYELGLINRVFPKDKLMEETLIFAEKLTRLPH
jgi:enoyl-CoA hydratase